MGFLFFEDRVTSRLEGSGSPSKPHRLLETGRPKNPPAPKSAMALEYNLGVSQVKEEEKSYPNCLFSGLSFSPIPIVFRIEFHSARTGAGARSPSATSISQTSLVLEPHASSARRQCGKLTAGDRLLTVTTVRGMSFSQWSHLHWEFLVWLSFLFLDMLTLGTAAVAPAPGPGRSPSASGPASPAGEHRAGLSRWGRCPR